MSATTADSGGDDELRSRSQQSPLASQRTKASNAPNEANRTGRMSSYFTLGYKEGFSQWVRNVTIRVRCAMRGLILMAVDEHTSCNS